MKEHPGMPKGVVGWMGSQPCGCVTWLYSGKYDTPKQREKALIKAIKEGLKIDAIKEGEEDDARKAWAWSDCPHIVLVDDPVAEARRLLK
jgi:hypothetical protein